MSIVVIITGYVCTNDPCKPKPDRAHGLFRSVRQGARRTAHISRRAAQLPSQADNPPIRWLGGGAAVGGSHCTASRRLHIASSEFSFSRGSRRAAVGQAREAACSLE